MMSRPDRRGFIGGSDIAAIIGVSPWKDALSLYLEKRGELPPDDEETKAQRRGKILEPAIIELARAERDLALVAGGTLEMPGTPMRAQVDAWEIVDDQHVPHEIKSASEFTRGKWGPDGTDDAPAYYLTQLHWQMNMADAPFGRIVALLGSDDLRVYSIERDREIDRFLLAEATAFWQRVQKGEPPDPDFSHIAVQRTLRRLYRDPNASEVRKATPELRRWRDVYLEASEQAKRYEAVADGARAHLLAFMRDAAILDFADGTCLERKLTKRKAYAVDATEYVAAKIKHYAGGKPALPLDEAT